LHLVNIGTDLVDPITARHTESYDLMRIELKDLFACEKAKYDQGI